MEINLNILINFTKYMVTGDLDRGIYRPIICSDVNNGAEGKSTEGTQNSRERVLI